MLGGGGDDRNACDPLLDLALMHASFEPISITSTGQIEL